MTLSLWSSDFALYPGPYLCITLADIIFPSHRGHSYGKNLPRRVRAFVKNFINEKRKVVSL